MTLGTSAPSTHQPIIGITSADALPERFAAAWVPLSHSFYGEQGKGLDMDNGNRGAWTLTGIAVIDADRYVVRLAGPRAGFYPATVKDHGYGPSLMVVNTLDARTKAAAFGYFTEHQPTEATTAETLAELNPELDDRDLAALVEFVAANDARTGPRIGDYVTFPDLPDRFDRFSHDHDEHGVQTCKGGSFHFSKHGANMSGSLDRCRKRPTLSETGETWIGDVWIWHHGRPAASNGITVRVPLRVFVCAEPFDRPATAVA